MSDRYFMVESITKTAQKDTKTDFDKSKVYTGTPSSAARKAFTHTCTKFNKDIRGRCTLSVTVKEVYKSTKNGVVEYQPRLDDGREYKFKYALKLKRYNPKSGVFVQFPNVENPIIFKYKVDVVKSFGRV